MAEALTEVVISVSEKTELQRLWSDVNVLNIAPYKTLEKQGLSERDIFRTEKW